MKKIDPQIKNDFTLKMQDEIDAIEMIADMFFRDIEDDDGNITTKYTPYLEKIGQVNAIVRYFLTGVEFDDGEDVYDAVMEDKDIEPLVKKFMVPYGEKIEEPTREQKIMGQIMDKVYDMIEFRKAKMIAQTQNESNAILTYKILELIEKEREKNEKEIVTTENLNAWVDEQRKQQEELNTLITPEMQKKWFDKLNNGKDNFYFILQYKGEDIGLINVKDIDYEKKTGESGIFIYQDKFLNTDISYRAHLVMFDYFFDNLALESLYSHVLQTNKRAQRFTLFLGGFLADNQESVDNQLYIISKDAYKNNKNRIRFVERYNLMKNKNQNI